MSARRKVLAAVPETLWTCLDHSWECWGACPWCARALDDDGVLDDAPGREELDRREAGVLARELGEFSAYAGEITRDAIGSEARYRGAP